MSVWGVYKFNRPNGEISTYSLPPPAHILGSSRQNDMSCLQRQCFYFRVLQENLEEGETMTPDQLKDILLQNYNYCHEHIGQDLSRMRDWNGIYQSKRGHYGVRSNHRKKNSEGDRFVSK